MIKVFSAATPLEAQLIRGLLESEGIEAMVQGEALWTARGELPFTEETLPSVWVHKEHVERARKLIEENEQARDPAECGSCGYDLQGSPGPVCPECGWSFTKAESWVCTACGETIEGQFAECWKCAGESDPEEATA